MITTWPNELQYVGVSTTIRPVTQTAEVEVKSASMKERLPGRRRDGHGEQPGADEDRRGEAEYHHLRRMERERPPEHPSR